MLRIEDTDKQRNTEEAIQVILRGMRWLGLDWDEGPEAGGDGGPYFQSQRFDIYERYFERLKAGGWLFEDNGAWRFRSPRERVVVDDIICGRIEFDLSNPDTHPDMTIRRPDGSWIFHFVNVVDDIEMRITHVIRGEDHLSNTPKHLEVFKALGAEPPRYAHMPLILNKDGSKMSKRDQGASVASYIEGGYAPEAVRNYLCLLGWSPKDDREVLPIEEVVARFDLVHVNRKAAVFDLAKCDWLNAQHIQQIPMEHRESCSRGWKADRRGRALRSCWRLEKMKVTLARSAGPRVFFFDENSYDAEAADKTRNPVRSIASRNSATPYHARHGTASLEA